MTELRELRAVLVGAPPLLVDLIRRVAATRLAQAGVEFSIVAEVGDPAAAGRPGDPIHTLIPDLIPDLIIVGQSAALPGLEAMAPVLALSPDLTHVLGPGPDDIVPLTPESLAAKLLAIPARGKPRFS